MEQADMRTIVFMCCLLALSLLTWAVCESVEKLAKYRERKRRRYWRDLSRSNVTDIRDHSTAARWHRMIRR